MSTECLANLFTVCRDYILDRFQLGQLTLLENMTPVLETANTIAMIQKSETHQLHDSVGKDKCRFTVVDSEMA